jgi:hypothetical protein
VNNQIIIFGGGVENSSAVAVANISDSESDEREIDINLYSPTLFQSGRPIPRLTSTMARIGKYLVVFGGFNNERQQLGDFVVSIYFTTPSCIITWPKLRYYLPVARPCAWTACY